MEGTIDTVKEQEQPDLNIPPGGFFIGKMIEYVTEIAPGVTEHQLGKLKNLHRAAINANVNSARILQSQFEHRIQELKAETLGPIRENFELFKICQKRSAEMEEEIESLKKERDTALRDLNKVQMAQQFTDKDIVFDERNPLPLVHYMEQLEKLFEQVATDASQDQKNLLALLGDSIMKVNQLAIRKIEKTAEAEIMADDNFIEEQMEKVSFIQRNRHKYSLKSDVKVPKTEEVEKKKKVFDKLKDEIWDMQQQIQDVKQKSEHLMFLHGFTMKQLQEIHEKKVEELENKINEIEMKFVTE